MKSQHQSIKDLPKNPGIYKFIDKDGVVLYVGKATELKNRVKSYFSKDLINTRGPAILDMVTQADRVDYIKTDTVLEALILEAELIKKLQPKYNVKEKDDKSFLCVVITDEDLPKVLTVRKKDIDLKNKTAKILRGKKNVKVDTWYGPFTNGQSLKIALRIIRRIFPYIDIDSVKKDNIEFYRQLGLSPDVKTFKNKLGPQNSPSLPRITNSAQTRAYDFSGQLISYSDNIKNLKNFFSGKKQNVLRDLRKAMANEAKKMNFERASEIKKQIFALEHINDIALIRDEDTLQMHYGHAFRIEAYDIAHMSGKNMVGVMVVVDINKGFDESINLNKSEYKKFNIKTVSGANDPASLKEVLTRRFSHTDWTMPDLIVVDGNEIQINVTRKVLDDLGLKITVVSVVKDQRHKARDILIGDNRKELDSKTKKAILLANSEAHRFAINFHKQKRSKDFLK